ncbi:uncharacterized protein [Procambarus clarkii]|uniref:uncharacterized protein n=1 Tax=Procambarus clarkii TaxID=6728 RepID=UPI00374331DB
MASVGGLKEEGTVHKMRNDGTLLQSPASPQHMSPASPQHMSPASPQHMSPASPQHMSPASPQHMSPVSLQHSQQLQTSEDFKNKITVGFNCHGQDIGDQVRHTVPQHLKGHDNDGASGDEFQTGNGDEKNILENNDSRSKSFKYVSSLDDGCKNNLPDMQDLVSKDLIANGQEALYEGCQSYLEGVDKGDWTDKEVCQDRELRHSQKDKSRFCQTKDAEVVSGSNLDVWYDDKECLFGDSKCDQSLLGQFPGTDVESSSIDVVGYGGGCRMCKSAFNASSKCPISLVCGHMICSPCVLDLTESYTCPDCFTKVKDSWLTEDNTDNQSELEVQEISEIEGTITVPYSTPPLGSMSSTPIRSTGDVSTLPMVSTPRETLALTPTLPPHGSSTLTQPINVAVLKLTTHNQLTECATGAPAPPRESAAGAPVNPRGEGTDTKTQPTGSKSGTPEQPTGRANYNIPPETWDMFKLWILQKVDEYGFDGEAIWNNLNQSEMLMLDRLLYGKDDDAYQSQRKVAPSTRPENSHTHMIDGPGGEEPLVTSRVPLPGSHGQCGAPSPGPQERSSGPFSGSTGAWRGPIYGSTGEWTWPFLQVDWGAAWPLLQVQRGKAWPLLWVLRGAVCPLVRVHRGVAWPLLRVHWGMAWPHLRVHWGVAWPLLWVHLGVAWPLLRVHLGVAWPLLRVHLGVAWPLLRVHLGVAWPLLQVHLGVAWPLLRVHLGVAWLLLRVHLGVAWPLLRVHRDAAWPLLRVHRDAAWPLLRVHRGAA